MHTNILEYLEHTLRRSANKIAFTDGVTGLTFQEVSEQARAIGTFLHRKGICKQPVVVLMKKQPRTITAFFGAVYAGCYYVPLDAEMPRHRIEMILKSLQAGALICDESTQPLAQALGHCRSVYRYEEAAFGMTDDAALSRIREQQIDTDPIYVVFTSGSTGVPKGVIGCHRAVIDYIEHLCEVLRFDEHTVFGNQTPLYFDACLKEILPTLKYGAATHLIPKSLFLSPVRLVEYLNAHRINTLCWVVSALTFISSLGTFRKAIPSAVHTIAFASEVFPIRQLNLWRGALPNARFINLYGPTETTGICCYYEVDREFSDDETLPIGRPFRNTQILLLDEHDQVPPPGEQGEICIRGTRLTLGYYCDPERTNAAFVPNPLNRLYPELIYRTGDIGKYNERGELVFLSRKDNQIKHMGHRIELGEIEAAAAVHESVNAACCIFADHKITLYYAGTLTPGAAMDFLRDRLPRYMLPHKIRKIEAMPLTPNGKIDRNLLKQRSDKDGQADLHSE